MKRWIIGGVTAAAAVLTAGIALAETGQCYSSGQVSLSTAAGERPAVCVVVDSMLWWAPMAAKMDASASVNFGSIALGDCATLTTSPNALADIPAGALVTCGPTSDLTGDTTAPMCWMSAKGVVSIKVCNANTLLPVDPPAVTFNFRVHL